MHDFHQKVVLITFFSEHFKQTVSLTEDIKVVLLHLLSQKPAITLN